MEKAGNIIEKLLAAFPAAEKNILGNNIEKFWSDIEGVRDSWVERFASGVLFAASENPATSQEMVFRKDGIIKKINKRLGQEVVKDIKIRIAEKPKEGKE